MSELNKPSMPKIDAFHYHEIADRCDVVQRIIEDCIFNHPAMNVEQREKIAMAQTLIASVYQWAAQQADAMLAASEPKKSELEDPLDTPLPCDIKVGAGTIKKGCKLRTLVARMEVLNGIVADSLRPKSKDPAFESLRSLANDVTARQVSLENVEEPQPDANGCSDHPDAPHGFNRSASLSAGRYVCDCEDWKPDAKGWIELEGDECPVATTAIVEVEFAGGSTSGPQPAGNFRWDKAGLGGDIIAYRVVK